MPTIPTLLAFAVPALICVTMPGPAVLYIIAQGIRQGRGAGLTAVVGVDTGTLVHVLLIALGLGAVIASSPVAFDAIRLAGAGYLIVLGFRKLAGRNVPPCMIPGAQPTPLPTIWARGLAIQLFNPSIILFLLALMPQFVDPEIGSSATQLLVLGLLFLALELLAEATYAVASGGVASWLGRHPQANLYCGRFSGAVFLLFGIAASATAVAS